MVVYKSNPYPGGTELKSGVFEIASTSYAVARRKALEEKTFNLTFAPAYLISLQFTEERNFNFSDTNVYDSEYNNNETIPACRMYVESNNDHVILSQNRNF